jgi:pyruvate dehydrogenase E2 component (dihydrolipoamide acetyltransferase)
MATPVIMPRQGLSVESCVLTEWEKEVGDRVKKGDLLFSYETDKANFEEEAEVEGILLKRFFEEGDDVPVLTIVCVIGEEGEDVNEFAPDSAKETKDYVAEDDTEDIVNNEKEEEEEEKEEDTIKISPRARKLAEKNNLDYRHATPTGPEGRIIERDIEKMIDEGPIFTPTAKEEYVSYNVHKKVKRTGIGGRVTTADLKQPEETIDKNEEVNNVEYEDVALTNIRKVIARSMHHSLTSTAQLTIHASFDASSILNLRKQVKERHKESGLKNITINDMILFAVSRTVLKYQELNAHFLDDKIRIFRNVHLGVAVDTERGLMVPTIFNANLKTLNSLAGEVKTRIKECREGNIKYDNLHGATFTVTNLGSLDIESFTPVLNPPQTGILGVNTIIQRARERDGKIEYYPAMGLSLTFDHRAIDGAPAARFLKELKTNLENFLILMTI